MKIAYLFDVVHPYSKGGIERRTWEMAVRHARRGHDVTIFGMKMWDGADVIRREGVRLVGVCEPFSVMSGDRRSIGAALWFGWKSLVPLVKERFDVVNASIFPYFPCYSAKFATLLHHTPLIISWFEIWDSYWTEYVGRLALFGKMVERSTVKLPDSIIVETDDTKRGLVSWGYDPDRIHTIPSGVDCSAIDAVAKGGPEVESDVLFVGRLVRYKGVHTLVEAMHLLKKRGIRVHTSIVGDGPERGPLQDLAAELGVSDLVRFHGRVEQSEDVVSIMKASKMFAYPAAPLGGWALTPLEANAAGLPVITTRSGPVLGKNEVVVDGTNGYLLSRASPELIADKVALLLRNDGLRSEMSARAKARARSFDWDNQTTLAEDVYERVASGGDAIRSLQM